MAFGSSSAMFQAWVQMLLEHNATGYAGLETDDIKVALFNNSVSPDRDADVTSTGYDTGTWQDTNEVVDTDGSSNWSAGGLLLTTPAVTDQGSGITRFDADDLSHSSTVTISNAYGCFVYDDDISAGTVAKQGISYHSFGGAQSVTTGTFTIVWHANGLFQISVGS
jgi:hypothetical protein